MYSYEGMAISEIADEIHADRHTVSNWLKKCGVELRTNSESKLSGLVKPTKEEIGRMYLGDGMSLSEIANEVGVCCATVFNWMQKYGIKTRTISESQLGDSVKLSKKDLKEMYSDQLMTPLEIGQVCGVSGRTVLNWICVYGIESRLNSDYVGKNHGNWRGGISFEPYCDKFNNKFKELVRERDGYICQLCGCEQNGRKLDVHHIHYDKANCYPDVVALCRSCNSKVNGDRDYWEQYFENQLLERGMINWSMQM